MSLTISETLSCNNMIFPDWYLYWHLYASYYVHVYAVMYCMPLAQSVVVVLELKMIAVFSSQASASACREWRGEHATCARRTLRTWMPVVVRVSHSHAYHMTMECFQSPLQKSLSHCCTVCNELPEMDCITYAIACTVCTIALSWTWLLTVLKHIPTCPTSL